MAKGKRKKPKVKRMAGNGGAVAGPGHNLSQTELRKVAAPFIDRLDRLHDGKEAKAGEFMADIKTVYDDMAGKLGIKRSSCRTVYQDHRREKKRQAREAEMEAQERDDLDRLRDAVGLAGTPLGDAADRREAAA